jgi:uncharacterized membrane protein YccC
VTGSETSPPSPESSGAFSVLRRHSSLADHLRIDFSQVTPIAGAITALPLIVVFILGLTFSTPQTAIAMAIGANLIAVVSLVGAPRLSLRLALLDVLTMGLAVFVGTITGPWPWLHLAIMVPWCFAAGMLVVFGQTQATVGSQAIIAYVVLGRFAGSPLVAVHLSLSVIVGALVEVSALVILRLPPSLRFQRIRLASAYEAVAELSESDASRPATDLLSALDAADVALSSPALFSRTDVQDLRAILDQARRIRLELTTIAGLRVRLNADGATLRYPEIEACLRAVTLTCNEIAGTLRRSSTSSGWRGAVQHLRTLLAPLQDDYGTGGSTDDVIASQCVSHLNAINGQLRSAGGLIDHLREDNDRHVWRPSIPSPKGPDFGQFRIDVSTIRGNLRTDSSAFRHAIRLAVAVPLSFLVGSALGLPRSYWLPFAVAVILKPDYSTLVKRGLGRLVGTMIGATMAAVLVSEIHPGPATTTIMVAIIAWIAYSTWAASFPVAIGFITAMVLILLSTSTTVTIGTALDRLLDISLGGFIAVVAYLVWPTSPRAGVSEAQSQLFAALHDYLDVVSGLVSRRAVATQRVADCSKKVRLAWAKAEAAVGRSIEEPAATRIDPSEGRGLMSVTMRILRAIHAMRIEAERGVTVEAFGELDALFDRSLQSLERLSHWFVSTPHSEVDDLRPLYKMAEKMLAEREAPTTIAAHLDELVNAINTANHLSGLLPASVD